METLAVDGSTLPGLKDLFPEHFFEHPEQAMHPQQQGSMLPQLSDAVSQLTHQQQPQNIALQQQEVQYAMSSDTARPANARQPSTLTKGNSGKRSTKRTHDAAHAQTPSHPQPQDPYFYPPEPAVPMQQFPTPTDVHLQLPGALPQSREETVDPEADEDADGSADGEKRRHPCPRCGKRFNRPSSLKIHLNTHTGAKPYVCPFQGCGRTFNVSSNMRRHFRNHARRPPPPLLPQNNIYTLPPAQSSDHQELRGGHGKATQQYPFSQQHSLSLPPNYDTDALSSGLPDYSAQFYPPSSDVRSDQAAREQQYSADNALITPPYTNEGDEHDLESEAQRNLFPPIAPYNSFGPGPERTGVQQTTLGMQLPMGMPYGVGHTFPVDPALVDHHNDDPDADGEIDPELEDISSRREDRVIDGGDIRRFGPSTSNARASSNSRSDPSAVRRPHLDAGNNMANSLYPVLPSSSHYFSLTANSTDGTPYRQVSASSAVTANPAIPQNAQISQQYQASYAQQAQPYPEQQTSALQGVVDTIYRADAQYAAAMQQLPHTSNTGSTQYAPYSGHLQQYSRSASSSHNAYDIPNGFSYSQTRQRAYPDARSHPQNIGPTFRHVSHRTASDKADVEISKRLGTAPAPPYQLSFHLPSKSSDGDQKGKGARGAYADQNADADYDDDESEGEDGDDDYDDDDDEYTGRPTPKKGKAKKGAASSRKTTARGRGRPRGQSKNDANISTRGRGRPRKSAPAAIDVKAQRVEEVAQKASDSAPSPDGMEVGGRLLRKRRRVSTR